DTVLFHSILVLLPEQGIGMFASYNTATAGAVPSKLLRLFLDHYYPLPARPAPAPLAGTQERINRVTGAYLQTRSTVTRWTKVVSLLDPVTVSDAGNGRLRIKGAVSLDATTLDAPTEWVEVEPYVFRRVDTYDTVVFRAGVS